jgi:hypothetical protein
MRHAFCLFTTFLWVNQAPCPTSPPETKSYEVTAAVIGAIVGALLAGWLTYVAAQSAEESKQKKLILRLYSLLLLEILGHHQPTLYLEVDELLPTWLNRRETTLSGTNALDRYPSAWQSVRLQRLTDRYHRRFSRELIHADLIVELETYYHNVRILNQLIDEWRPEKAKDNGIAYATHTIRALKMGIDVTNKIRKTPGISRYFVDLETTVLENCDAREHQITYLLILCDLKLSDLESLRRAEQWENKDPEVYGRLGGRPPKLDSIPEIVRDDRSKLWKQYLTRANNMPLPRF